MPNFAWLCCKPRKYHFWRLVIALKATEMNWFPFTDTLDNLITNSIHAWLTKHYVYWAKYKQSNSRTSLTTLCSHFLLVIRPWLNLSTDGHGPVICMGDLGGVLSWENTPQGCTETHKSLFFSILTSGRNGDHEWFRMTNTFILCDLVWKVQKSHAANREGSFNSTQDPLLVIMLCYLQALYIILEMYSFKYCSWKVCQ